MSPAPTLTPQLALDYLRELSADIRAGVVLGADGALLAGSDDLAGPARDLLERAGGTRDVHVTTSDASVFAARSDAYSVVLVCGRYVLPSLVRHDLRLVLAELAGREAA